MSFDSRASAVWHSQDVNEAREEQAKKKRNITKNIDAKMSTKTAYAMQCKYVADYWFLAVCQTFYGPTDFKRLEIAIVWYTLFNAAAVVFAHFRVKRKIRAKCWNRRCRKWAEHRKQTASAVVVVFRFFFEEFAFGWTKGKKTARRTKIDKLPRSLFEWNCYTYLILFYCVRERFAL